MRGHPLCSSDDEIAAIGRGLIERTLSRERWTHAAHFAATLWILERTDLDAQVAMPRLIRAYNESVGTANTDSSGYHETITRASLRAAREFLAAHREGELFTRCNALLASELGDPGWLLRFWSRERLFSVEARRNCLEPDLRPLAFSFAAGASNTTEQVFS